MKRGDQIGFTCGGRGHMGWITAAKSEKHPGMVRVSYLPYIGCENLPKRMRTESSSRWIPVANTYPLRSAAELIEETDELLRSWQ